MSVLDKRWTIARAAVRGSGVLMTSHSARFNRYTFLSRWLVNLLVFIATHRHRSLHNSISVIASEMRIAFLNIFVTFGRWVPLS